MKNGTLLFLSFLLYSSIGHTTDPLGHDELIHENKGCPINSTCSKASGSKRLVFENFIKNFSEKTKINDLKKFHKENGLPIQFLTTQKAKLALDPILWSSRCDFHNPKNPNEDILKGEKFFKTLPHSEQVILTPITVYDGHKKKNYYIPYGDQVSFIKNDKLIILKDYDDFYFQIAISENGQFEVVDHSFKLTNLALERKIPDIKCPETMEIDRKYFSKVYCNKTLDLDSNDLKIVQYAWSCP